MEDLLVRVGDDVRVDGGVNLVVGGDVSGLRPVSLRSRSRGKERHDEEREQHPPYQGLRSASA